MLRVLLLLSLVSCGSTPSYTKRGREFDVSLHRFSPYDCKAIKEEKHPRLALMKTRSPSAPNKQGLLFTEGSEYLQHTDTEWLIGPADQEIYLVEGPSCHFLWKKPKEQTFSLYQLTASDKYSLVRSTPYTKVWANYPQDYMSNFVNGALTEHPFFGNIVAGHPSKSGEGFDVEIINHDARIWTKVENVLENTGKAEFKIFKKKSQSLILASHPGGGETALSSSMVTMNTPSQKISGVSTVGEYPLYFWLKMNLNRAAVKVTRSGEESEFSFAGEVAIQGYSTPNQMPEFPIPHGAKVIGMRRLLKTKETPEGVLEFENDPAIIHQFEEPGAQLDPMFAVKLKYPSGKVLWHLIWGATKTPIDPVGFLDIRRLSSPFPDNTLVALNEAGQWQITGFVSNPAYALLYNEMQALRASTLLELAEKYTPLAEARMTGFKQQQEREREARAREYQAYLDSLPSQCRKLINQPALLRGCMNGHEKTMQAAAESRGRIAEEERRMKEAKRPINWRKGAMSGDNYYHLDQKKMIREIDNKLACELGRGLCIR